ncbi:hypothetical protein CANARDRAFT_27523 [[Candida] arabinofermentans NRRL YB-2248]|uniref:Uncharacterized protein n=1 Tax=[Candida] arabinofermentans NRRL YB-2248 TaxID=983967 RepID=A0A1E4T3E3_9ASCO|nr:hypothetical protein CANARDRAFT_27523 [[Candida] arabinofermentans NRRL YB-2248]
MSESERKKKRCAAEGLSCLHAMQCKCAMQCTSACLFKDKSVLTGYEVPNWEFRKVVLVTCNQFVVIKI